MLMHSWLLQFAHLFLLQAAVEREDYEQAKQIKMDADRLRAAGEAAAGAPGQSPARIGSHPDEIFSRVLQPQMAKGSSAPTKADLIPQSGKFTRGSGVSMVLLICTRFHRFVQAAVPLSVINDNKYCAEGDQNTADNFHTPVSDNHSAGMDAGAHEGPWHEEVPAMANTSNGYYNEEPSPAAPVHPPAGASSKSISLESRQHGTRDDHDGKHSPQSLTCPCRIRNCIGGRADLRDATGPQQCRRLRCRPSCRDFRRVCCSMRLLS